MPSAPAGTPAPPSDISGRRLRHPVRKAPSAHRLPHCKECLYVLPPPVQSDAFQMVVFRHRSVLHVRRSRAGVRHRSHDRSRSKDHMHLRGHGLRLADARPRLAQRSGHSRRGSLGLRQREQRAQDVLRQQQRPARVLRVHHYGRHRQGVFPSAADAPGS